MSLADFSNQDVIVWMRANVPGQGKQKEDLIKVLTAESVTGEDLVDFTGIDDLTQFGVSNMTARRVVKALKKQYPNEFLASSAPAGSAPASSASSAAAAAQQNKAKVAKNKGNQDAIAAMLASNEARRGNRACGNANGGGNGNRNRGGNGGDYQFQVSIFVGKIRKLTRNKFRLTSTVLDLKREIAQNEAGGDPADLKLIYVGKPLTDSDTLKEAGVVNSQCWVNAVIRVNGGAALPEAKGDDEKKVDGNLLDNGTNSAVRDRFPRFKTNKNISPSFDVDCVTFDDDTNELRVKMPCGHVFSALTIFNWCQRTLQCYSKSQVLCPILECEKEWKIDDIVCAADLDQDEHASLFNVLTHRQLMADGDFKECPSCEALVELPDTVYLCRVRCAAKNCPSKKDFCWLCNKEWNGNGLSVCGHKDCVTNTVNDILKIENCGTTTEVMGRTDVVVPKRRACPRCLSITEYKAACKHMVCWSCKRSFCFVCLALAGKEVNGYGQEWACEDGDNYSGKCKVAPVQVIS